MPTNYQEEIKKHLRSMSKLALQLAADMSEEAKTGEQISDEFDYIRIDVERIEALINRMMQ